MKRETTRGAGAGRRTLRCGAPLAALFMLAAHAPSARAEDAASEFNPISNLSGAPWSHGWKPTPTGAFTLFATHGTDGVGQTYWNLPSSQAGVYVNPSSSTVSPEFGTSIPARTMTLMPGLAWEYATVRWTAGVAGDYQVRARFTARSALSGEKEVVVMSGGTTVFSNWINPSLVGNTASMSTLLPLAQGETIEFLVGPTTDSNSGDWVGLDATVILQPPSLGPAGPVFAFGGERFVPCRWPGMVSDAIAFDSTNDRFASGGQIYDHCGNAVSAGPGEAPGLAWDPLTQTWWQITNDRVVKRWNGNTVVETVFTIPLSFTVPGSGLDTLESVRGIAVDDTYVYVVDAGPNPGQLASNAWFKFTRTGTPVKSSKSTDLVAHLDMDPDALVDDIVYVPPTSPFFPGRLLVALEHSGIQVLDTQGNYVDKFRWSTQGLTRARSSNLVGKVGAFAGLAIDPATGNLYLEDNDSGNCQVWTRLSDQGATSIVLGTGGTRATLEVPNPGCTLPLWVAISSGANPPSNFFAYAYRPSDHALYTCDYNPGELWRFDARTGAGARVGHTGVSSIWGVTYDPERDVLYGLAQGGGSRIVVLDPVTGNASALPQPISYSLTDLAFDSAGHNLYAIAQFPPPAQLVRIDRDSGAAVAVGPTISARALDYDAATGKLLAVTGGTLYAITPATGAYSVRATLPTNASPDGMGVVPVPANPSLVAAPVAGTVVGDQGVQVWPNPSDAGTRIQFSLAQAAPVKVGVYDVRGRLVRELQAQRGHPMAPGQHLLDWDGRDGSQREVANGVYFVRVESAAHTSVAKIMRVR